MLSRHSVNTMRIVNFPDSISFFEGTIAKDGKEGHLMRIVYTHTDWWCCWPWSRVYNSIDHRVVITLITSLEVKFLCLYELKRRNMENYVMWVYLSRSRVVRYLSLIAL